MASPAARLGLHDRAALVGADGVGRLGRIGRHIELDVHLFERQPDASSTSEPRRCVERAMLQ
ncbi:hypothetical protein BE17_12695 [Sorangium cellulosum]|uniref:Uncharacterized protein n=1 Tax=Sorangium cellulosum TaxID=56 RepID=A0A150RYA1_SORCE|nr:hypothetical protein BE17_12695 [Sorangium cellulosum]